MTALPQNPAHETTLHACKVFYGIGKHDISR